MKKFIYPFSLLSFLCIFSGEGNCMFRNLPHPEDSGQSTHTPPSDGAHSSRSEERPYTATLSQTQGVGDGARKITWRGNAASLQEAGVQMDAWLENPDGPVPEGCVVERGAQVTSSINQNRGELPMNADELLSDMIRSAQNMMGEIQISSSPPIQPLALPGGGGGLFSAIQSHPQPAPQGAAAVPAPAPQSGEGGGLFSSFQRHH